MVLVNKVGGINMMHNMQVNEFSRDFVDNFEAFMLSACSWCRRKNRRRELDVIKNLMTVSYIHCKVSDDLPHPGSSQRWIDCFHYRIRC